MDESAALNPKQLLPSPVTVTVFQFLSAAEPKNDSQSIQKWVAITTIEGTNVEFCQNQENGCQMQMDCLFSVGELSFSLASSSSVKLFTKQMMTDCRHTENSDLTDEISSQNKFWPEGSIVLEKLLNKVKHSFRRCLSHCWEARTIHCLLTSSYFPSSWNFWINSQTLTLKLNLPETHSKTCYFNPKMIFSWT